jgi:hypothetical protein
LPPDEITRDLATTSAKIRALAQAGYDRTEISGMFGIPYQHGDCCKFWGQAAIAMSGDGSLAGRHFCPKPEPSVPL